MKLFVNDLTVMDFSYLCPQRGMVGESWIVDIVLNGGLNDESMVQDFGIVKKQLKKLIDEYVDHKLVVPAEYKQCMIAHDQSHGRVSVEFRYADNKHIALLCPPEAYAFVYNTSVNMSSVTRYLKDVIKTHLPDNVHDIEIKLRTEQIDSPYYHYTHGLKKHDGNCQRIAHGHRSKVVIIENDQRSEHYERYWAERFEDIYIATREDVVACDALTIGQNLNDDEYYGFMYEASQGAFELVMPKSACEIITYDSTVECLAQFMLEELAAQNDSRFVVQAYEGVGKGAIIGNDD